MSHDDVGSRFFGRVVAEGGETSRRRDEKGVLGLALTVSGLGQLSLYRRHLAVAVGGQQNEFAAGRRVALGRRAFSEAERRQNRTSASLESHLLTLPHPPPLLL